MVVLVENLHSQGYKSFPKQAAFKARPGVAGKDQRRSSCVYLGPLFIFHHVMFGEKEIIGNFDFNFWSHFSKPENLISPC